MIILAIPSDLIGREVSLDGVSIGLVTFIKPNMEGGRRYAWVQPHDPAELERRIPIDELDLVSEK